MVPRIEGAVNEDFHVFDLSTKKIGTDLNYKHVVVWPVAVIIFLVQSAGVYGFYLLQYCDTKTAVYFLIVTYLFGGPGVVIGAHRLYTHRTLKAKWIVRLFLLIGFTSLGQNSMHTWVRDHRLHHKYADTDADPHNVNRGLFFAHMGWLMCKKHPMVIMKGKRMYMEDIESDPMVMFQKRYFPYLYALVNAVIVSIPVYFWGESFYNSFFITYAAHYLLSLHTIWTINSLAHFFGAKPYDRNIDAVDNWIIHVITLGEGMHNYHHTFPWDYRSSNYTHLNGGWSQLSLCTTLIEILASFGLIYDRKYASKALIAQTALKKGDGSYRHYILVK